MNTSDRSMGDHVGELMSGYIDGELTQQDRQIVEGHCEACADCRQGLAELRSLRERVGQAGFGAVGPDQWRERMSEPWVEGSRGIGWLLLVAGLLAIAGVGVYEFVTEPGLGTPMKFVIAAVYGGLAVLLLSVLRQRLIERKTDKYKDVEI